MNTSELLTWGEFKSTLRQHPESVLQFEYAENKRVDASYHITEIKQAPIVSVDCGGVKNSWTEIIVQLWEPEKRNSQNAMAVNKALSIISVVEKVLPLNPSGIVKIEFGNSEYQARQMYPADFSIEGDNLIVNLDPDFTQCKAIGRGGSCGTEDPGEECCAPSEKKTELVNLASSSACCTPGGGCC